jgi:hypothetical protein
VTQIQTSHKSPEITGNPQKSLEVTGNPQKIPEIPRNARISSEIARNRQISPEITGNPRIVKVPCVSRSPNLQHTKTFSVLVEWISLFCQKAAFCDLLLNFGMASLITVWVRDRLSKWL